MHSRIFQISRTKIEADDFNGCSFYEDHWIVGGVADYVTDNSKRYEDLEWVSKVLINKLGDLVEYNEENQSFTFKDGFKEAYFESNFNKFKELTKSMTLHDFATSSLEVYKIKSLMADDFSFYFDEDGDMNCMDTFIRESAVDGEEYFIGGTVDFHC